MGAGIVSYGVSFPYYRVDPREIHKVWLRNMDGGTIARMGLTGRGVVGPDEDPITLAVDAARKALDMAGIEPAKVEALFVGSQTNPYTTKSMMSVIGDMLLLGPDLMGGDCQFSGKSGTMALQAVWGLVKAGIIEYGLVIATDALSLHVAPGNPLEYTAAAGAAAFLIGRENVIAEIGGTASYSSDTTDYYRLDEERFLYWGGTAMSATQVGMPNHLRGAVKQLYQKYNLSNESFTYAALPQENEGAAYKTGQILGFDKNKIEAGVFSGQIGDCGSATALIALAKILETADEGEKILLASYGYGAGSDAFSITKHGSLQKGQPGISVSDLLKKHSVIDYPTALKYERKYSGPSIKMSTYV